MTVFPGKGYDEIKVGDTFGAAVTITDAHLVLAAGLIGDSHPLHLDQQFAEQTRFGGRVLHGVFTGALVGGPVGTFFAGTGIAYLAHNCRFTRHADDGMDNCRQARQASPRRRAGCAQSGVPQPEKRIGRRG